MASFWTQRSQNANISWSSGRWCRRCKIYIILKTELWYKLLHVKKWRWEKLVNFFGWQVCSILPLWAWNILKVQNWRLVVVSSGKRECQCWPTIYRGVALFKNFNKTAQTSDAWFICSIFEKNLPQEFIVGKKQNMKKHSHGRQNLFIVLRIGYTIWRCSQLFGNGRRREWQQLWMQQGGLSKKVCCNMFWIRKSEKTWSEKTKSEKKWSEEKNSSSEKTSSGKTEVEKI